MRWNVVLYIKTFVRPSVLASSFIFYFQCHAYGHMWRDKLNQSVCDLLRHTKRWIANLEIVVSDPAKMSECVATPRLSSAVAAGGRLAVHCESNR